MENILETDNTQTFNAIIAVDELGVGVLLSSTPSLYENDLFDGLFLNDNLTSEKNVPKQFGVYKCEIKYHSFKYWTDCGYEYDCKVWLENVESVLPNAAKQNTLSEIEGSVRRWIKHGFQMEYNQVDELVAVFNESEVVDNIMLDLSNYIIINKNGLIKELKDERSVATKDQSR